jgi:hypothetical protein
VLDNTRIRLLPPLLAAAFVLAGCGQLRSSNSPSDAGRNSDDLTQEDLADYSTVMEAVQAIRPIWLRQRTPLLLSPRSGGTEEASPVWIYWDGTRLGDPSYLGRIAPSQVARVVHYDARTASLRWGIGHENGVIYLVPVAGAVAPTIK